MNKKRYDSDPFDILDTGAAQTAYTENKNGQNLKGKRSRKRKKRLLPKLLILAVLVLGAASVMFLRDMKKSMNTTTLNTDNLSVTQGLPDDVVNIALFGIDARSEGAKSRSDTIIILSVDTVHGAVKLSSVMRDSYVKIPGRGYDKLNHAYAFGGAELAIATLNENFDLNITHYATVDFADMASIIDNVGGVEVEIMQNEIKVLNQLIDEQNSYTGSSASHISQSGMQLLNGTQATAYSRIRSVGNGDYRRTERQRTVLMALFNKMLSQPITKYPAMAKAVFSICETNFTLSELPAYLPFVIKKPVIYLNRFPQDSDGGGKMIGGVYYMAFDTDATVQKLHDFIYNYNGEEAK